MEIAIVSAAMAFGPETLRYSTVGGSETAGLMAAKEFAKRGHIVNVFTNLPAEGRPDFIRSGEKGDDGVRYLSLENFANFVGNTEIDLLVVLRDPRFVATTNQAKKRVLWMHDVATIRGMKRAFEQMAWTFDEVWAVSEWHKNQIHKATGYPLKNIVALRNGIVPVEVAKPPFRLDKTICYAARPERGLANFITEGGIMEHLSDYTLKLSTYANYPKEMEGFYQWCNHRINALPNVELPEELTQTQMRQRLADVTAYVYPTQFEETSCILARECIEQRTPILTTKEGALPETLGECALYFEDWFSIQCNRNDGWDQLEPEKGSKDWCALFAEFVRWALESEEGRHAIDVCKVNMDCRSDLYWDGVVDMMLENCDPKEVSKFSRAWSLVQDGDVIPAYHYLLDGIDENDWASHNLLSEIERFYPFILEKDNPSYRTLADYYKEFYAFKKHELKTGEEGLRWARSAPRYQMIANVISKLPAGSTVYEYGAGEGHVIVPLAMDFPNINFIAFDQVQQNIDMHGEYGDVPNLQSFRAETPKEAFLLVERKQADAVICVEVLEHCVEPWSVITDVEAMCKEGGKVIITTPIGAWEPQTFAKKKNEYHFRNHIWHLDKNAIRKMYAEKKDIELAAICNGHTQDGIVIGNYFYTYSADHVAVQSLDPLDKALAARSRQSCVAAIIAYDNADTILRMLNSLDGNVQAVQIALGPCTDRTPEIIDQWQIDHPWIYVNTIDVPKIAAPQRLGGSAPEGQEFGFDDARNKSVEGLYDIFDWVLWIDTDEYLSGNFSQYLRHNCLDGYLIPQHHFTVEPRGGQTQIDRPARLFRASAGYRARGHIHEHFEVPAGGPGHCFMLPNVDIGHTGYVNENVRQDRFARNYPFLAWDHETCSDRKLHPFLWYRDIVHRMRYAMKVQAMDAAVTLAKEGENYYQTHIKDMGNYGAGLPMALAYLAEIRKVLQKGVPLGISFRLDDREAGFEGIFLDTAEVRAIIDLMLEPEFRERTSRYY